MTDANLIENFCILDEFCKYFAPELKKHTLDTCGKRRRNRPCLMSDSKVMTILVLFHTMRQRDLKSFYLGYVCNHMRKEFLRVQPHAQGVSTPPVVQPLRRTSGQGRAPSFAVPADMCVG